MWASIRRAQRSVSFAASAGFTPAEALNDF
jgi:hypothetical protein